MPFTHRAFHEAAMFVQDKADDSKHFTALNDNTPQEFVHMAREIGSLAQMACHTPDDVVPLMNAMRGTLRHAFLSGLHGSLVEPAQACERKSALLTFVSAQLAM